MKKGFTLIELLAVIVILAIIALIATPIILGIIKNAKNESNERSVDLYVKAAELAVARKNLTSEFKPTECTVANGECTCDGETLNVEVENGTGINGTITFNDKGIVTDNTLVVGTAVGEQYLYQWLIVDGPTVIARNVDGPTVGNPINLAEYTEANGFLYSTTAPAEAPNYNKFKIEDNVVTEGYTCAILGGEERCLRGLDKDGNSFYGDETTGNKGYLKTLDGKNGISCTFEFETGNIGCHGGGVGLYARSTGVVDSYSAGVNCQIYGGGSSYCSIG